MVLKFDSFLWIGKMMINLANCGKVVRGSLFALSLSLLGLNGCGGGTSLVKVTGSVTVDGQPADGAVLLFHPESDTLGSVSSAVADASGTFSPVTDGEPGIPAGTYRVTVSWPDPAMRREASAMQFGFGEERDPPDLLKGRYIAKDRSQLTVVIDRSTSQLDAFELSTR
jgi:hypothetical protein